MLEKYFIYKYTFPNGKVYIGKTSTSIKRYGIPYAYRTQLVYRAMMKYPDFKKEILEYFETEEKAFAAEREYIKKYNSTNPEFGYNVTEGGEGASILSMRIPVQQFSLEGIFIKEYPSIGQASLETNIVASSITRVCSNKYQSSKTVGGFQWKYKYDLKGNFIQEFTNIKEAAEKYNVDSSSISHVCGGKRKIAAGFQWRYSKDSSVPENLLEQNYDIKKPNKNAKKKEGEKND